MLTSQDLDSQSLDLLDNGAGRRLRDVVFLVDVGVDTLFLYWNGGSALLTGVTNNVDRTRPRSQRGSLAGVRWASDKDTTK